MSIDNGFSVLYEFDLGGRDVDNPGTNILSVTDTASGDFDKANLTTESLRHVWRSADASGWKEIVIQAEQATDIDTFFIGGHNFTDAAVVQVQANTSDLWVAPQVTLTLPWAKRNMLSVSQFGSSNGYYRVRVLDPSNPCGYIQIGRIVGGRALLMDSSGEDIVDNVGISTIDKADVVKTEGYFRQSNENVKVRTFNVSFSKLRTVSDDAGTNDNYLNLLEFIDYVGISKPFVSIIDRSDPTDLNMWGQLDKIPNRNRGINRYVSFPVSMTEVF